MRIIGGEFRSRRFSPGKNFKARPTTDFARENLFNILSNRINFEETKVLDLFAGTGSISFEFASRGSKDITCIEMNRIHFDFICSVVEKLNLNKVIRPINADVFRSIGKLKQSFNIIFADPPYELKRLQEIPDLVMNSELLNKEGLFILEHGKDNDFSEHPNYTEIRMYGSVHFSFFSHSQLSAIMGETKDE